MDLENGIVLEMWRPISLPLTVIKIRILRDGSMDVQYNLLTKMGNSY